MTKTVNPDNPDEILVTAMIQLTVPLAADPKVRAEAYEGKVNVGDCIRYDFDFDPHSLLSYATESEVVAVGSNPDLAALDLMDRELALRQLLARAARIIEAQTAGVKALGKNRQDILVNLTAELEEAAVTGHTPTPSYNQSNIFHDLFHKHTEAGAVSDTGD